MDRICGGVRPFSSEAKRRLLPVVGLPDADNFLLLNYFSRKLGQYHCLELQGIAGSELHDCVRFYCFLNFKFDDVLSFGQQHREL